jgi:hypothetical protein
MINSIFAGDRERQKKGEGPGATIPGEKEYVFSDDPATRMSLKGRRICDY